MTDPLIIAVIVLDVTTLIWMTAYFREREVRLRAEDRWKTREREYESALYSSAFELEQERARRREQPRLTIAQMLSLLHRELPDADYNRGKVYDVQVVTHCHPNPPKVTTMKCRSDGRQWSVVEDTSITLIP